MYTYIPKHTLLCIYYYTYLSYHYGIVWYIVKHAFYEYGSKRNPNLKICHDYKKTSRKSQDAAAAIWPSPSSFRNGLNYIDGEYKDDKLNGKAKLHFQVRSIQYVLSCIFSPVYSVRSIQYIFAVATSDFSTFSLYTKVWKIKFADRS